MSASIEQQFEEARQALPTPPGSAVTAGQYAFRTIGIWIALVALFVLLFHVFNRQQEERNSQVRPSGSTPSTGR